MDRSVRALAEPPDRARLQEKLRALAPEISADLSALGAAESKELLSDFVSDLFLATAEQKRREEHRQRQAEGIAEAKARGVRFGRPAPVLPDNFDQVYQQWQEGALSVRKAAGACGMTESSFYYAATRKARSAQAT